MPPPSLADVPSPLQCSPLTFLWFLRFRFRGWGFSWGSWGSFCRRWSRFCSSFGGDGSRFVCGSWGLFWGGLRSWGLFRSWGWGCLFFRGCLFLRGWHCFFLGCCRSRFFGRRRSFAGHCCKACGLGKEDVLESQLRDPCSVLGFLLQIKDLSSGSELWTPRLEEGPCSGPGVSTRDRCSVLGGGNQLTEPERELGDFYRLWLALVTSLQTNLPEQAGLPGIATRELHIQQPPLPPPMGWQHKGPAPPAAPLSSLRAGQARARSPFFGDMAPVPSTALVEGFPSLPRDSAGPPHPPCLPCIHTRLPQPSLLILH